MAGAGAGPAAVRGRGGPRRESLLTRIVDAVFAFVRLAEFEILFLLFFLVAFLIFKDLSMDLESILSMAVRNFETSRPEYNQILVKKSNGGEFWPH